MLSPVICRSKNTERCFQSRYLFWSCTFWILTTGVKIAPGSVTNNCTLTSGWSHSALSKNWKAACPCGKGWWPQSILLKTCIWLGIHSIEAATLSVWTPDSFLGIQSCPYSLESTGRCPHSGLSAPQELLPVALPCFCLHILINPSHLLFIKYNHKGTT